MTRGLAIAVVALAVHVALGLALLADPLLPGDDAALELMSHLRFTAGVDVIAVLTDVGAVPVAGVAVAAGALWATAGGRRREAIALIGGFVLLLVAVHVSKGAWGRPRPQEVLSPVRGLSYPSGHAAYATAWLAAAVLTRRRGLIALAAVVVLAVMASRLYLHVHYLSDVVGGVALGVAVFAVVGVVRP